MIIPGAEGVMTGICCMLFYIATAVQSGWLDFSFYFRFHVQETLSTLTQTDVTKIYHALN